MKKLLVLLITLFSAPTFASWVYLFTSSGTTYWTCPTAGYYEVWTQGGGGGGGGGAGSATGDTHYGGGGKAGAEGQMVRAIMYFSLNEVVTIVNGIGGAGGIGSSTNTWGGMSDTGGNSYVRGLAAGGGAQAHGGPPDNTSAAGQSGHGNGGGSGADGNGTNGSDGSGYGSGGGGGGGVPPGYGSGGNGGAGKNGWARIFGPL